MDYRSQMQRDLDRSATVNVPRISLNSALARSVHDSVGESPVTTILAPISPVQSVFTIEQSPQSTPSERRILRRMPAGLSVNRSGSTRSFLTAASIETNTGSVRGFEFRTEPPRPFRVSYTDNLHTGFTGVTEDTASVYGAMSEERGLQKESGFLKEPDRKDESDRREDVYYDAQDGLESPCPQVRPARNTASEQIHMGATPFVVMTKAPAVAEMKSRHHAAFPLLSKPHPNTTITMNPSPNTEIEIVLERSSQLVNDIARETNKLSQQAKRFCTPSPTLESPVALDTQQRVQQPWVTEEPRKQDKNFRPATPVDLAETGRVVIPSPLKHTNKNNPNPSPTTPCKRPAAVARWVHLNTHEIIEMDGKHIPISRPDLPHDPHGDGTFTPDYEVEENPMMIRDPSGVKHDVARTPNRLDLMATKATNRTVAAPKHVPASEPVSGPAEDVIRHIYPHKINSPGTYWNQQRQRKSLPLRDYENMATGKGKGKSAIPQGTLLSMKTRLWSRSNADRCCSSVWR